MPYMLGRVANREAAMDSPQEKIAQLEARVEALNATVANVLSTLVLHGLLTKATVDSLMWPLSPRKLAGSRWMR